MKVWLKSYRVAGLQSLVGKVEELQGLRSETTETIQATNDGNDPNDENDGTIFSDFQRFVATSGDDKKQSILCTFIPAFRRKIISGSRLPPETAISVSGLAAMRTRFQRAVQR